jgi:hypothetical protein
MMYAVVRTLEMLGEDIRRVAEEVVLHMVEREAPSNLVVEVVLHTVVAARMVVVVMVHHTGREVRRKVDVEGVRRMVAVEEVDCTRLEEGMESGIEEDILQSYH